MLRTLYNEEDKTNVESASDDQEGSKSLGGQEVGSVSQPFELNWPKSFITDASKVSQTNYLIEAAHTNSIEYSRDVEEASMMPVRVRVKSFHLYESLEIKSYGTYSFWGRTLLESSPPVKLSFHNAKIHGLDFYLGLYFEMNRNADKSSPLYRPLLMQIEVDPRIQTQVHSTFLLEVSQ